MLLSAVLCEVRGGNDNEGSGDKCSRRQPAAPGPSLAAAPVAAVRTMGRALEDQRARRATLRRLRLALAVSQFLRKTRRPVAEATASTTRLVGKVIR
jgi:hypothetical protein